MTQKTSWTVTVEQDGEDLVLPLPQEMLELKGWEPGDVIQWIDLGNGVWELRRKNNDD